SRRSRSSSASSARRAGSPCSATPSTTSCSGGNDGVPDRRSGRPGPRRRADRGLVPGRARLRRVPRRARLRHRRSRRRLDPLLRPLGDRAGGVGDLRPGRRGGHRRAVRRVPVERHRARERRPGGRALGVQGVLRLRPRREPDHVLRGAGGLRAGAGAAVIRLGRISYVNMAPVFHRLDADVEEVAGVPTDLNDRLLSGDIDLAPVSSIEYGRHAADLRILPRMCVSSEGAVDSIQLVSRAPLERVRSIAVTPESATSVVLTTVLLPDADHVPLGEEADAKLLIGDAALKSAFEDPTPHFDLGRLWLERTGLPMVFAVWACPEPLHPGLAELEDALVASVRLARAEPEQLAHEASLRYGYPAGFLARYFEKLRYRFGPRERAGLYTFLELARDAGLLETVPELRFVQTTGAAVA